MKYLYRVFDVYRDVHPIGGAEPHPGGQIRDIKIVRARGTTGAQRERERERERERDGARINASGS